MHDSHPLLFSKTDLFLIFFVERSEKYARTATDPRSFHRVVVTNRPEVSPFAGSLTLSQFQGPWSLASRHCSSPKYPPHPRNVHCALLVDLPRYCDAHGHTFDVFDDNIDHLLHTTTIFVAPTDLARP
jgi:hypothetical protein